ncbi:MAG: hypothetical protein IJP13_04300 [Lachnospiraceae bacterium]|nr:hypothetical protein [Lachnospiraceae bacterium]
MRHSGTDDAIIEQVTLRLIREEHYNQSKSYIERIQTTIPGYTIRKAINIREHLKLV